MTWTFDLLPLLVALGHLFTTLAYYLLTPHFTQVTRISKVSRGIY